MGTLPKRLVLFGIIVSGVCALTACDRVAVSSSPQTAVPEVSSSVGAPPGDLPPEPAPQRLVPDLPGAPAFSESLRDRLAERVVSRHPAEAPRTRHLGLDGRPSYTNRLALESSPYLRQHAHNPVNWFPWGDEAFELARQLERPIFLSVGYSTCHWCHVMEEESFEDVEIAQFLNAHFVPIKVDREQRPDVDDVYMVAVQLLSGRGGWPMTVVMTPEGEPFFGATYLPARDGDRGARTGLLTILQRLDEVYTNSPAEAVAEAGRLSTAIARASAPAPPGDVPTQSAILRAVEGYLDAYDAEYGGIGGAPKFPQPARLGLLMRVYRRTGDERLLDVVTSTLRAMAEGGVYDQVGGGFHRYATDRRWLVPHFEKMLYDNAQLAVTYLEGYQLTGDPLFARVARETLDYVAREMTSPEGGFYSATDADSEGEEGRFFVWTPDQLRSVLGEDAVRLVTAHYGVTEAGNFEGRSILHVARPLARVADDLGIDPATARQQLDVARQTLYEARSRRIPPGLDDKVLTAWNGLMIGAFARGAWVLDEPAYRDRAVAAAEFVWDHLWSEGRLRRSYRQGAAVHAGYLDDYAYLASGLLDLFELTGERRWLERAIQLQDVLDARFADLDSGAYYFTPDDGEELLARRKPDSDGARPSGNSIAAENLLRLAELTTDVSYRRRAERLFAALAQVVERSPGSAPRLLSALDFYLDRPRELVLVAPTGRAELEPFFDVLESRFLPNRVLIPTVQGSPLDAISTLVPLVEYKVAQGGQATAYVCEAGICERPTTDPEVFASQLAPVRAYE